MAVVLSFAGAVSLSAAAAIGPGAAFNCLGCKNYSMQVLLAGAPATAIVALEGTIDGVTWFALKLWDVAAPLVTGAIVSIADVPCKQIRANCTTLTTGSGKSATAILAAS